VVTAGADQARSSDFCSATSISQALASLPLAAWSLSPAAPAGQRKVAPGRLAYRLLLIRRGPGAFCILASVIGLLPLLGLGQRVSSPRTALFFAMRANRPKGPPAEVANWGRSPPLFGDSRAVVLPLLFFFAWRRDNQRISSWRLSVSCPDTGTAISGTPSCKRACASPRPRPDMSAHSSMEK